MMNYYAKANSIDEKIMNFDIAKGWDAFVKQFDEAEIAEVREWMEGEEFGYDYESYEADEDIAVMIISDYVREWLCENVKMNNVSGARKLFSIVFDMI